MSTLSQKQIIRLGKLITETWVALGKPGYDPAKKNSKAAGDSFRHAELFECTSNGAASLKDVLNRDFEAVESHFHQLAGNLDKALNSEIARQSADRKRCVACISQNLAKAAQATGDAKKWSLGYAVTIARAEYGRGIEDLEMGELKQLVVTIAARTRNAIKKARAAAPVMPAEECVDEYADANATEPEVVEVEL